MVSESPRRGEVYWVDFSPGRGSDQMGLRPALVVQNDVGNRYAPTTIVAAITSKAVEREYPTDVRLPDDLLPKPSKVLCSQLLTVATDRLERQVGQAGPSTMERVERALKRSLDLR